MFRNFYIKPFKSLDDDLLAPECTVSEILSQIDARIRFDENLLSTEREALSALMIDMDLYEHQQARIFPALPTGPQLNEWIDQVKKQLGCSTKPQELTEESLPIISELKLASSPIIPKPEQDSPPVAQAIPKSAFYHRYTRQFTSTDKVSFYLDPIESECLTLSNGPEIFERICLHLSLDTRFNTANNLGIETPYYIAQLIIDEEKQNYKLIVTDYHSTYLINLNLATMSSQKSRDPITCDTVCAEFFNQVFPSKKPAMLEYINEQYLKNAGFVDIDLDKSAAKEQKVLSCEESLLNYFISDYSPAEYTLVFNDSSSMQQVQENYFSQVNASGNATQMTWELIKKGDIPTQQQFQILAPGMQEKLSQYIFDCSIAGIKSFEAIVTNLIALPQAAATEAHQYLATGSEVVSDVIANGYSQLVTLSQGAVNAVSRLTAPRTNLITTVEEEQKMQESTVSRQEQSTPKHGGKEFLHCAIMYGLDNKTKFSIFTSSETIKNSQLAEKVANKLYTAIHSGNIATVRFTNEQMSAFRNGRLQECLLKYQGPLSDQLAQEVISQRKLIDENSKMQKVFLQQKVASMPKGRR